MGIKHEILLETDTIILTKGPEGTGDFGYWLWDETRQMNLVTRAGTEREAFVKALDYHQKRSQEFEEKFKALKSKVENFVGLFVDSNDFEVE